MVFVQNVLFSGTRWRYRDSRENLQADTPAGGVGDLTKSCRSLLQLTRLEPVAKQADSPVPHLVSTATCLDPS